MDGQTSLGFFEFRLFLEAIFFTPLKKEHLKNSTKNHACMVDNLNFSCLFLFSREPKYY